MAMKVAGGCDSRYPPTVGRADRKSKSAARARAPPAGARISELEVDKLSVEVIENHEKQWAGCVRRRPEREPIQVVPVESCRNHISSFSKADANECLTSLNAGVVLVWAAKTTLREPAIDSCGRASHRNPIRVMPPIRPAERYRFLAWNRVLSRKKRWLRIHGEMVLGSRAKRPSRLPAGHGRPKFSGSILRASVCAPIAISQ
jgi:hypothetical protein